MDKLVRRSKVPLARKAIEKAGLYLADKKDFEHLAEIAADAYRDYPLHSWFAKGNYDKMTTKLILEISLKTMAEDAVIYADSEEMNGFAVWLTFENYAMNLKKELTGHNDWYLYNLSIKMDAQGKGIASKLMHPMLQFCDDEKMVAYLETNKDTNVGLYQHYGFDLMKEENVPKTSVKHYAMVRQPQNLV